ncbi:tigger transposable element-derived protein 7-like [Procambarus clarkii]|uniref:tigger transposable element-derived protein 7-like n=1 Tax=Procambarus clarkii TaxID=6728 RepID=UPI003742824A
MSQGLANRAVSAKRKRSFLSIEQKLDMIEKHERGYSVTRLAAEFNVGKSTVCDIKRQKDNIRKFLASSDSGALNKRKTIKGSANTNLDEAVYKWFNQERSVGMPLGGDAIKTAADKFAQKMNIPDFRASEGWLQRFKNRHNIKNRKVCGESLSADTDSVEPFKRKLNDYIITNDLRRFQVYNADETGFNWKCLQNNTLASRLDESVPGRKVNKEKVSAMLCANADGSHRTKSAIVGKSKNPRALKNLMNKLPVVYYSSKTAWFTGDIFVDWFKKHFCKEVRDFQIKKCGVRQNDVKALLLVDNAPAHVGLDKLTSHDGRIKCMALPPNTTSLIQPMDMGVIYAMKRLYKREMNKEIMVVFESDEDKRQGTDSRGQATLERYQKYSIKEGIYNWAKVWDEVQESTLRNCWKKLLLLDHADEVTEEEMDFEGFSNDIYQELRAAGETELTLNDVEEWLDIDAVDQPIGHLTDDEIIQNVTGTVDDDGKEDEDENDSSLQSATCANALFHVEKLLDIVSQTDNPELPGFYQHLRTMKDICLKDMTQRRKQMKMSQYFSRTSSKSISTAVPSTSTAVPSTSTATVPSVQEDNVPQPLSAGTDNRSRQPQSRYHRSTNNEL